MHFAKALFLVAAIALTSSLGAVINKGKCVPGGTCKMPHCRCWNDPDKPGKLVTEDIPQMVLISFSYAVNSANVDKYLQVFQDLKNPNKCLPKGTFFVQGEGTSMEVVTDLYKRGHEIALTTEDGQITKSYAGWMYNFEKMFQRLRDSGVPGVGVNGVRGPSLFFGGDPQMRAMSSYRLAYDSTCVTRNFTKSKELLWPYTLDYPEGSPQCNSGLPDKESHPGLWEFSFPVLTYHDQTCPAPSSCSPFLKTRYDVFDMLFFNFMSHYEGSRAPFNLYIDPLWLIDEQHMLGTREFLQFLLYRLSDVWLVSYSQALDWIKNPVASDEVNKVKSWNC